MKRILVVIAVLLCADIAAHFVPTVHAQSGVPAAFSVSGLHTACPAAVSGQTWFCAASDGFWASIQGAAYVQLGAPATQPTSFSCVTGSISAGSTSAMAGSSCTFK
jgi:hypothetical protein